MLLSGGSPSFPGMNWLTLQLPPTVRSSGAILLGNTLKSTHSSTFSTLPTPPTVNSPTLQLPLTNGTTPPLFNFSVIGSSQRQGSPSPSEELDLHFPNQHRHRLNSLTLQLSHPMRL